jgi:hypothetical protein
MGCEDADEPLGFIADADCAAREAAQTRKALLLVVTAAEGDERTRLSLEALDDERVAEVLEGSFIAARHDLGRCSRLVERLTVLRPLLWTPTCFVLDDRCRELRRWEGLHPGDLFAAEVRLALATLSLLHDDLETADHLFGHVATAHPTHAAEALYWQGAVARRAGDRTLAGAYWRNLRDGFPGSVWAARASASAEVERVPGHLRLLREHDKPPCS